MSLRSTHLRSLKVVTPPPIGLEILTPAQAREAESVLASSSDDSVLFLINKYANEISDYIGFRPDDNQENHLIFASYQEVRYIPCRIENILVERWPVNHIESLYMDGSPLTEDSYLSTGSLGRVAAINSDGSPGCFNSGLLTINYIAGWKPPGYDSSHLEVVPPALPQNFLQAIFELLRGDFYGENQEPGIRSESTNQVETLSYFKGGAMAEAWESAHRLLRKYRRPLIS